MIIAGCTSIVLIAFGGCSSNPSTGAVGSSSAKGSAAASSKLGSVALSVDDALGWRSTYGDLLGKPREAVVERFGPAKESENDNSLSWDKGPKTADRSVTVFFDSAQKGSIAQAAKVFARPGESLDPVEILKKAPMFEFSTGTYKDSLVNYFTAQTKDGRNIFQFDVSENGIKFRAMLFARK